MKWLEKIQQAENINQLPRFAELQEIAENEDDMDLFEEWSNGMKVVIADGTTVQLEHGCGCFDSRDDLAFYVAEDIYICADCGLMQSFYEDIRKEVGCSIYDDPKLLPLSWNIDGVRSYLKKGIEMQKEREARRVNYFEYEDKAECYTCRNMINGECSHGFDEQEMEETEEDCSLYLARY